MAKRDSLTRRGFLRRTAAAIPLFTIVPRHVLGGPNETPPSEMLNVAGIGAGGQAMHDLGQVSQGANIVAFADVDDERAAKAFERWPDARTYKDFRVLLEKEAANIDAVVVATPDHVHAVAALTAMQLGKHVYVEKPMAHSIHEVRRLMAGAKQYNVVTQMGNQGHSMRGCYQVKQWIEDEAIGEVREVHCWTNRPSWPQGLERPTDTPPVPATLEWDLWLGPAQARPYHPAYCPRNWRGWWDFGCGALGDMGCHVLDAPFFALDLGAPVRVSCEGEGGTAESGPKSSVVRFEFPKRGNKPEAVLTWYDGGKMPSMPAEVLGGGRVGDYDGGSLLIGSKGVIAAGTYGMGPKLFPKELDESYEKPKLERERSKGHHLDWLEACKTHGTAASNFDYAGPLTELVLLGALAQRINGTIEWDGAKMEVTNLPEANRFLKRDYREGWAV